MTTIGAFMLSPQFLPILWIIRKGDFATKGRLPR